MHIFVTTPQWLFLMPTQVGIRNNIARLRCMGLLQQNHSTCDICKLKLCLYAKTAARAHRVAYLDEYNGDRPRFNKQRQDQGKLYQLSFLKGKRVLTNIETTQSFSKSCGIWDQMSQYTGSRSFSQMRLQTLLMPIQFKCSTTSRLISQKRKPKLQAL